MDICSRCETALPGESRFCPRCGAPTATGAEEDLLASSASDPTGLLDRLRWATEGEFEIVRELGRGGMGRVYLAQEIALDRRVALKVLPPSLLEHPEIVDRFQREARTAGRLRHPNIVSVYQVTERRGIHFFTMPYIAGPSLRQVLRQTPRLEVALCARYLVEAAGALHHAHGQGVIHRDLKPENMLLEGSRDGRLLLTDFGIAKALDSATSLTRPGDMIGTPYYMSPELCRQAPDIDGRSDQYSLGLVAYEMLAGRFPFSGDSVAALVYKHLNEEPPSLSELRPDIPAALRRVIEIATRKDPDARYPTMAEFAAAVSSAVDSLGTARIPGRERKARRPRWRWAAGIAALAAVLILAAQLVHVGSDAPTREDDARALAGPAATDAGLDPLVIEPATRRATEPGSVEEDVERDAIAEGPGDGTQPRQATGDTDPRDGPIAGRSGDGGDRGDAGEADPIGEQRRQVEQAGEEARQARRAAERAGADSVYPEEFGRLVQAIGRAETDLASGSLVAAARGFDRVRGDFERLAEEALLSRMSEETGLVGVDSPAIVEGAGAGADSSRVAPEPAGEGAPIGSREVAEEVSLDSAVVRLLETYRQAFEAEDLERMRLELYDGELPEEDEAFLRQWFDRAEDFAVSLDLRSLDAPAEGSPVALLRQTMRYRLTSTRQPRDWSGSIRMMFRAGPRGWRLERLELAGS